MSRPFIFIDAEGGESEAVQSSPALASFCHISTAINPFERVPTFEVLLAVRRNYLLLEMTLYRINL